MFFTHIFVRCFQNPILIILVITTMAEITKALLPPQLH